MTVSLSLHNLHIIIALRVEGRKCRNLLAINHTALLYQKKKIKCFNVQSEFLNKASRSKNWTILLLKEGVIYVCLSVPYHNIYHISLTMMLYSTV